MKDAEKGVTRKQQHAPGTDPPVGCAVEPRSGTTQGRGTLSGKRSEGPMPGAASTSPTLPQPALGSLYADCFLNEISVKVEESWSEVGRKEKDQSLVRKREGLAQ